jgi:hypothetical protein
VSAAISDTATVRRVDQQVACNHDQPRHRRTTRLVEAPAVLNPTRERLGHQIERQIRAHRAPTDTRRERPDVALVEDPEVVGDPDQKLSVGARHQEVLRHSPPIVTPNRHPALASASAATELVRGSVRHMGKTDACRLCRQPVQLDQAAEAVVDRLVSETAREGAGRSRGRGSFEAPTPDCGESETPNCSQRPPRRLRGRFLRGAG